MPAPTSPDRRDGLRLKAWLDSGPPRPVDIAREAGVSRQYVNDVLTGRAKPSPKIIAACSRLGVPVELIFGPPADNGGGKERSHESERAAPAARRLTTRGEA